MSVNAVLVRVSTQQIIKFDVYPRSDMALVVGLDPDLAWLVEYIPNPIPTYDPRLYDLVTTKRLTKQPHPVYPHLYQFRITYSLVKKTATDIQSEVQKAEITANNGLMPSDKMKKLMMLSIGLCLQQIDPATLGAKKRAIYDLAMDKITKVWQNDQALLDKLAQIASGTDPDFDNGWINTD